MRQLNTYISEKLVINKDIKNEVLEGDKVLILDIRWNNIDTIPYLGKVTHINSWGKHYMIHIAYDKKWDPGYGLPEGFERVDNELYVAEAAKALLFDKVTAISLLKNALNNDLELFDGYILTGFGKYKQIDEHTKEEINKLISLLNE